MLLQPVKNCKAPTLLEGCKTVVRRLVQGGCKPKLQRPDNEVSELLKEHIMHKQKINFQLVPPHKHRTNAAKRAICMGKNHLTAGWCSMNPDFPLHLWDQTIPCAEFARDLLCGSCLNPKLSAYEQIHRRCDFNRNPIAPPGMRCLAHEQSLS